MTTLNEPVHAGEHLVSEANGNRSRSVATITGGDFSAATVLAQEVLGAALSAVKSGGNTGNGTMSAVAVNSDGKSGVYKVRFTSATKFNVEDPNGFNISKGTVGTAYDDDLGFTITAGGTPFVADDGFDITVEEGNEKFSQLDLAAENGMQTASAVLFARANATDADVAATIHDRDCEVNGLIVIWPEAITDEQKAQSVSDLAERGIIVRS